MAIDPRLQAGKERLNIAMEPVEVDAYLGVLVSNRFAKWNWTDGDLDGFVTTSLMAKSADDVGFYISEIEGVIKAVWAIMINTIVPENFT